MNDYQIFCDSSCDLPPELIKQHQIEQIPFYISFDRKNYQKEHIDISIEEFYERLTTQKVFPATSLPSIQDYANRFKKALEAGKDVLCICLTAKFSGSFQSAVNAKSLLEEDYPDSRIEIINSFQATVGEGLTVLQAVYMKEAGYSLDKVKEKLLQLRNTSRIFFTVNTLEYLQKGGRIGKVSSIAGNFFDLHPLIQLKEAELHPIGNVMGRKRSKGRVLDCLQEYFTTEHINYADYDFIVANAACPGEARLFAAQCEEIIHKPILYPSASIGVTIGTYTGPDAIGIAFIRKFDADS